MRNKIFLLSFILVCNSLTATAFSFKSKDHRKEEAKYIHKVLKEEEKEKYERRDLEYDPSGFMTKEAYESLSGYRDKSEDKIEIPITGNKEDITEDYWS